MRTKTILRNEVRIWFVCRRYVSKAEIEYKWWLILTSKYESPFFAKVYPASTRDATAVPVADRMPSERLPILSSRAHDRRQKINLMNAVKTAAR